MENASRAFLDAIRKSMRQNRKTLGATRINPNLLTAAERLQYEGYLRREQTNAAITALAKDGVTIKEIVRRTGHSRGLVRQVLRGQRNDVFRESSLEPHLEWLDAQWPAGKTAVNNFVASIRAWSCPYRFDQAAASGSPNAGWTCSSATGSKTRYAQIKCREWTRSANAGTNQTREIKRNQKIRFAYFSIF
jgi:hypothetical protein